MDISECMAYQITSTDLKSDGNEVAIDTIEIAHEQLTIINGK